MGDKITIEDFIEAFEDFLKDIDNNTIDLETYDIDNC